MYRQHAAVCSGLFTWNNLIVHLIDSEYLWTSFGAVNKQQSEEYEEPADKLPLLALAQKYYISLSITFGMKMNCAHRFAPEARLLCRSLKHRCKGGAPTLLELCSAKHSFNMRSQDPWNVTCNASYSLAPTLWDSHFGDFSLLVSEKTNIFFFFCFFCFQSLIHETKLSHPVLAKTPESCWMKNLKTVEIWRVKCGLLLFSTAEFEMSNFFCIWTWIGFTYCCHPPSVAFPLYWGEGH